MINCFNLENTPIEREIRFCLTEIGLPLGKVRIAGLPVIQTEDEVRFGYSGSRPRPAGSCCECVSITTTRDGLLLPEPDYVFCGMGSNDFEGDAFATERVSQYTDLLRNAAARLAYLGDCGGRRGLQRENVMKNYRNCGEKSKH